jgi:hypothetical protein
LNAARPRAADLRLGGPSVSTTFLTVDWRHARPAKGVGMAPLAPCSPSDDRVRRHSRIVSEGREPIRPFRRRISRLEHERARDVDRYGIRPRVPLSPSLLPGRQVGPFPHGPGERIGGS